MFLPHVFLDQIAYNNPYAQLYIFLDNIILLFKGLYSLMRHEQSDNDEFGKFYCLRYPTLWLDGISREIWIKRTASNEINPAKS